jgi:hypothetical protein
VDRLVTGFLYGRADSQRVRIDTDQHCTALPDFASRSLTIDGHLRDLTVAPVQPGNLIQPMTACANAGFQMARVSFQFLSRRCALLEPGALIMVRPPEFG